MADIRRPSLLRRCLRGLGLLAILALTLATRLADGPVVFADFPTEGAVDFTDGDCYARMTRVKLVLEGKGLVIRHHDFENYPAGTEPHTTAPLDWLIALVALPLRAAFPMDVARDLAGAWIGPLLGAATALFLWRWTGRWNDGRGRPAAMIIFAASPILAHGQMVGRPDHQALLILLLAVALAGELVLLRRVDAEPAESSQSGAVTLGLAWGMALWVSLWEPVLLWLGAIALGAIGRRSRWWTPERKVALVSMGAVLLVALALEGVRISPPGWFEGDREAFQFWAQSIAELQPLYLDSLRHFLPSSFSWATGFVIALPALLGIQAWRRKPERWPSIVTLALLATTWWLTAMQARWGYFFALVAAIGTVVAWPATRDRWAGVAALGSVGLAWMALLLPPLWAGPILLGLALAVGWLRQLPLARWAAGVAFSLGLWITANELESGWFREGRWSQYQAVRIERNRGLRAAARQIIAAAEQMGLDGAIASSWWDAPALAYRTGRPAVTGSSHQAMDGNLAYTHSMVFRPAHAGARHLRFLGVRWIAWTAFREMHRLMPRSAARRGWDNLQNVWHPGFGVGLDEETLNDELDGLNAARAGRDPTVFILRDDTDPPWQAVE